MFSVSIRVYGTFSLCKTYRPQRTASLIRFSIPNLKCYVIPFVIRVSVRPPVHDLLCFRSITLPSNLAWTLVSENRGFGFKIGKYLFLIRVMTPGVFWWISITWHMYNADIWYTASIWGWGWGGGGGFYETVRFQCDSKSTKTQGSEK